MDFKTDEIVSILKDWNLRYKADIMADASAALGIRGRTGLGKLRHIDTSYLWLQQDSIKRKLRLNKVKVTEKEVVKSVKKVEPKTEQKLKPEINLMPKKEEKLDNKPPKQTICNIFQVFMTSSILDFTSFCSFRLLQLS